MKKGRKVLIGVATAILVAILGVVLLFSSMRQTKVEQIKLSYSGSSRAETSSNSYADYNGLKSFTNGAGFNLSVESNDAVSVSESYDESYDMQESSSSDNLTSNKKLKKVYNYSVETTEYDKFTKDFEAKISSLGGYIEDVDKVQRTETNSMRTETYTVRHSDYTVRVPADKISELTTLVEGGAYVLSQKENIEDVTVSYIDTEAHISALIDEKYQLDKLLETATTLSETLEINERLSELNYEIESYQNTLDALSHDVDYSKLYLKVDEVIYYEDTVTRFESDIAESWNEIFEDWLANVAPAIVLVTVSLVPMFIVFFLIAGVAISAIAKKVFKTKMKYQQTIVLKKEEDKAEE